jgi:Chaperone of endosialidase
VWQTFNGSAYGERMRMYSGGAFQIYNLAGSGTRTVTADASGILAASSDSSLKQEDTTHQVEGLAEILQLQPKAYKWLKDIEIRGEEATTEIGFFADEVAPIIPSAAPKCQDGLYGFYDRAVISAMVKAIQEQNVLIQELQEKLQRNNIN